MNEWHVAAAVLLVALLPCGWICARRDVADGAAGLQLAATLAALALLLISRAEHRQPFGDLALILAAVSFIGSLVLARFIENDR
jgi:multicomponent Na+:H+ antiporter subunit F